LHSASGMLQWKHFVTIHEDASVKYSDIPTDIIMECLGGLIGSLLAITLLVGEMKEIINPPESRLKIFDGLFYSEDFITFQHRKNPLTLS